MAQRLIRKMNSCTAGEKTHRGSNDHRQMKDLARIRLPLRALSQEIDVRHDQGAEEGHFGHQESEHADMSWGEW